MAGAVGLVCAVVVTSAGWAQTRTQRQTVVPPTPAETGETDGIVFGGAYTLNFQFDQTLNRSAGVKSFGNLFAELDDLNWYLNIGKYFSLNGALKMDQVRTVSKSSAFRAEGLRVSELYATVYLDPVRIYGGKIHPRFGKAWDVTPGLYGTDFAEDYELEEKLGLGIAYDLRSPTFGRHSLTFETFIEDTSFLSNSVFSRPRITDSDVIRPKHLRRRDGGVGNTGQLFDNFTVTLDGSKIPELRGFSYNLGFERRRGSKVGGEPTEHGFVAGFEWEILLTSRITMTPQVEFAYQRNPGGVAGNTKWMTASLGFELGRGWFASLYGTLRPVKDKTIPDSYTDYLAGFSVGYEVGTLLRRYGRWLKGLAVEAGYKYEHAAHTNLSTVGVSLTYSRSF